MGAKGRTHTPELGDTEAGVMQGTAALGPPLLAKTEYRNWIYRPTWKETDKIVKEKKSGFQDPEREAMKR